MLSESIDLLHKPPAQCTSPISHNTPVYNQNVRNFAAKSCIVGYFSDALWNWWDRSINSWFYSLAAFTDKKITKDWQLYWIQ